MVIHEDNNIIIYTNYIPVYMHYPNVWIFTHTMCSLGFGSTYSGYGGYGGYGGIGGYGYRPFGMVGGYGGYGSGYGASGYGGEEDSHFIRQAEVINQMINVTIKKCTLFPAFHVSVCCD